MNSTYVLNLQKRPIIGGQQINYTQKACLCSKRVQFKRQQPIFAVTEEVEKKIYEEDKLPLYQQSKEPSSGKPRVVILGSGWGSTAFIKSLTEEQAAKYDIAVVSPRNYFLYTPLLPAVATGTMEERSIVEPVRTIVNGKAQYFEAVCKEILTDKKELVACFPADSGFDELCFKIPYDILIVGVGCVNNTFGIQGVKEHSYLFKTVEDANRLRMRVSECFERASLPYTSEERVKQLLSFVIVGGGPTGVEVAAELHDMIEQDLKKLYPELVQYATIQVIELTSHLLGMYDRKISAYTQRQFRRVKINQILNTKVVKISQESLTVQAKSGEREIKFGACVWATGVAMNPLVKDLQTKLEGQDHFRSIITDERLCVKGSNGSIYAFGDAATIEQNQALQYADDLFMSADKSGDGKLQFNEIRDLLSEASDKFPHLAEHALTLKTQDGLLRWGSMALNMIQRNKTKKLESESPVGDIAEGVELDKAEFQELLAKLDKGLRALPATAQVAKQQGEFLAELFTATDIRPDSDMPPDAPKFEYVHKGSTAYVGQDRAVFDFPIIGAFTGIGAGLLWKSYESFGQFSWRNRILVATDWLRSKIFGRDISRV